MLRGLLESWVRRRYGYAVVVGGLMSVMVFNELIYQNSRERLTGGIQLTDLRIQAGRMLQLVTDAETGMRGYLLTGHPDYLAPYKAALQQIPLVQDETFRLVAQVDADQTIPLDTVRSLLAAKMGEMQATVALFDGRSPASIALVDPTVGMLRMTELRKAFDEVLSRAAALQQQARVSIYDAMLLNRLAVHLLSMAAALGLYVFMRQLQQTDALRQIEKQRLALEVQLRTAELRDLAGHLVRVREDERGHLARELHDELGGLFTAMKLEFARVRRQSGLPAGLLERLQSIERRLNEGISFKRRMVETLRPSALDQLGLQTSVELLCRDSAQNMGIAVEHELQPVKVAPEVELTVYRLVQESLTNVAKYARASHVAVTLRMDGDSVRAEIRDDGCGFDAARVAPGHHGLIGMRYRVESHRGSMQVTTAPGQGTCISALLPLAADADGAAASAAAAVS
jgi:signal transduction histidine kinase